MELQAHIGKEKMPSILNDPFKQNSINRIYVSFSQYSNKWYASGTVSFQNGNTIGEQQFKGETFDEVVLQIKAFMTELQS